MIYTHFILRLRSP